MAQWSAPGDNNAEGVENDGLNYTHFAYFSTQQTSFGVRGRIDEGCVRRPS
jgi:hypothetical protein